MITEEEKEVCAYGMELIISGIISIALVLIIGLITGNIWYVVVYNVMMVLIRTYTDGKEETQYLMVETEGSYIVTNVSIYKVNIKQ